MPAVPTFTAAERRARVGVRHALAPGHRAAGVREACARMVCLHATDPVTVYLSAWARVDGLDRDDVDRALYADRTLVKHMAMRRTLWVVDRDLIDVVQAAASDRVADRERRRLAGELERAGLVADGAAWLAAAEEATEAALAAAGDALTSTEIRERVPLLDLSLTYAPDRAYGGSIPVGPRVLTVLSASGRIVRGPNRGGWHSSRPAWCRTRDWLGRPLDPPDAAVARAGLVRRWLRAFGPATERDVAWWLGDTLGATRAALRDVAAVEVDLDGPPGVCLPDDLEPTGPVAPWAALLPALDPTTMGWAGRDWYLGPHAPRLVDRNGNAGPTAWWDGRVVGGWRQDDDGTVVVDLLEDTGAEARDALAAEAGRLTAWFAGARPRPRFPPPLWREPRP